jgi:hypothetical protein
LIILGSVGGRSIHESNALIGNQCGNDFLKREIMTKI